MELSIIPGTPKSPAPAADPLGDVPICGLGGSDETLHLAPQGKSETLKGFLFAENEFEGQKLFFHMLTLLPTHVTGAFLGLVLRTSASLAPDDRRRRREDLDQLAGGHRGRTSANAAC